EYADTFPEKFLVECDLSICFSRLVIDLHEEGPGCAARTRSFIQLTLVEFQALCVVSRIMRKSVEDGKSHGTRGFCSGCTGICGLVGPIAGSGQKRQRQHCISFLDSHHDVSKNTYLWANQLLKVTARYGFVFLRSKKCCSFQKLFY